ncbi:hypothetical protein BP5796_01420 [Coleophoma crateriformis]|uniref:Uncharacterized protein n=1 Tax=Coleophoma crateriformis TaxID=565419 RepID=A0A3D8T0E8_9HELO|nr:hypothetical protein BP5796_01420 [Coleophoma crateriformis]
MGVQPPFLYDAVPRESSKYPQSNFDPKAVSRASMSPPRTPRPKSEGPLISFNQHPDSYLILPYGNTNATPMNPSVKTWVKWLRIIQLILRCLEILGACGQLVMMILIRKIDVTTGWILRIVPGVAILHTCYAIWHLGRKASGRTPASSASYMLFASFFDVTIAPFYAFSAFVAKQRSAAWTTLLTDQTLMPTFRIVVFFLPVVSGGLHLISLGISLYLAVTFRNITMLPPDMNPLEDHLTSRPHKRNKSSVSTYANTENRSSIIIEDKRRSATAYEDLGRPPTIPFLHTRSLSTDSVGSCQSTPPGSRGSQVDLQPRQYQAGGSKSARSSMVVDPKKPNNEATYPLYSEAPVSDTASQRTTRPAPNFSLPALSNRGSYSDISSPETSPRRLYHEPLSKMPTKEAWYTSDIPRRTPSPKKSYQAIRQDPSTDDLSHPNPLHENPPGSRLPRTMQIKYQAHQESPLQEISNNRSPSSSDIASISNYSQDGIDDARSTASTRRQGSNKSDRSVQKKYYGELKHTSAQTPILVGAKRNNGGRQVSSSVDISSNIYSNEKGSFRRDVSGKIAEEGRAESMGPLNPWGTRLRKVSGVLM